jgi:hypothetical protein
LKGVGWDVWCRRQSRGGGDRSDILLLSRLCIVDGQKEGVDEAIALLVFPIPRVQVQVNKVGKVLEDDPASSDHVISRRGGDEVALSQQFCTGYTLVKAMQKVAQSLHEIDVLFIAAVAAAILHQESVDDILKVLIIGKVVVERLAIVSLVKAIVFTEKVL